jgi:hypothetical protein
MVQRSKRAGHVEGAIGEVESRTVAVDQLPVRKTFRPTDGAQLGRWLDPDQSHLGVVLTKTKKSAAGAGADIDQRSDFQES